MTPQAQREAAGKSREELGDILKTQLISLLF